MNHYVSELFPCEKDRNHIVCVITGSDGGIHWAKKIAKHFQRSGVPACAFAYWNYKRLPNAISCIPVEAIETMVRDLRRQGYEKVYLYGFSKGAELALVAASLRLGIDGVIAVSPSCAVFEGFSLAGYSGHSAWTFREKELPYIPAKLRKFNLAAMYLSQGGYAFLNHFTKAFDAGFSEENRIQVEHANCPILFLSAETDSIWPAARMSERMMKTLASTPCHTLHRHISYEKASHVLCPVASIKLKVFPQERKYAKECRQARAHAFEAALAWINSLGKSASPLLR